MTWGYFFYGYIFLPLAALAYVLLGTWLTFRMASKAKSWLSKVSMAVVIALLFIMVPSADVVVGRTKFSNLCETEAAVRVFRTVALDPKYLSKDGSPKTEVIAGRPGLKIGDRYVMSVSREEISTWPRIQKSLTRISDSERDDVLGEVIDFHYWGGWLVHRLPLHVSAESCQELKGRRSIERSVFHSAT